MCVKVYNKNVLSIDRKSKTINDKLKTIEVYGNPMASVGKSDCIHSISKRLSKNTKTNIRVNKVSRNN